MFERAGMLELLEESGVRADIRESLTAYAGMLLLANKRFNLTGAKSATELVPHLLDSLSIAPHVHGDYVDIGSGGGLPAIPLAIACGVPVTMIESVSKKASFLQDVLGELGLSGRVVAERAEVAAHDPELRERFACGTARAVSSASTVAELLLPLLAIGGRAVLQRGALGQREREALADASLMLGANLSDEVELDGERRVIILKKTGATPQRFPRRTGIPQKRPLCVQ